MFQISEACACILHSIHSTHIPKLNSTTHISKLQQHKMSEQPKDEKSDTHINLKVSDGTAEIFFKIKKTTPMKRLMEAFCKRQGKSMESLRFLIDGTRVSPDNTPEDLDLEDGDVIEAHREQVGGFL